MVNGVFKLADPGLARFQEAQVAQQARANSNEFQNGTFTYCAPELCQNNTTSIDLRRCDLWSFGCVLSEAATWMIQGRIGIKQYRKLRHTYLERAPFDTQVVPRAKRERLSIGDAFHDGVKVLPVVTRWHQFLRTRIHPTDKLTPAVLDLVDQYLFATQPDLRSKAHKASKPWDDSQSEWAPVDPDIECILSGSATLEANELRKGLLQGGTQFRREVKQSASFLPFAYQERLTPPAERRLSRLQAMPMNGDPRSPRSPGTHNGDADYELLKRQSTSRGESYGHTPAKSKRVTVFDIWFERQQQDQKNLIRLPSYLRRDERESKDHELSQGVVNRDLMFVVDNGKTMASFWGQAAFLLDNLARKTWNIDPDGLELRFCFGDVKAQGKRKSERTDVEKFMTAMKHRDALPGEGLTDMADTLRKILSEWVHEFEVLWKARRKHRDLTIIVLTDGRWQGMADHFAVDDVIKNYHEDVLRAINGQKTFPTRPVSIGFISFGEDPDALHRLQRLDNDITWKGVP